MTNRVPWLISAALALMSPMTSGMPPLDSGRRRDPKLGPIEVVDEPHRSTWRMPEVPREVPAHIQDELIARAEAKRARKAARR